MFLFEGSPSFGVHLSGLCSIPKRFAPALLLFAMACQVVSADTILDTGTLLTPEDTVAINLNLTSAGAVTLQTYGFGGGTDALGNVIAPGGFDPFVGLFSGSGGSAVFIDGTSDILSNYSPGCPPAGTVTIGSFGGQCGDVTLTFTGLAAGSYTILLTDGEYLPAAVFEAPGGTLGDGFIDLTGGVFQTCVDANDCNTDTGNWALDITAPTSSSGVPEPGSGWLTGFGCAAVALTRGRTLIRNMKRRSDR